MVHFTCISCTQLVAGLAVLVGISIALTGSGDTHTHIRLQSLPHMLANQWQIAAPLVG